MSDQELEVQRKKTNRKLMWASLGLSFAITVLMAQFQDNDAQASETATADSGAKIAKAHQVEAISENVILEVIELPDGRQVEILQVFPTANREYVCLGSLSPYGNRRDRLAMSGGGCFPAKSNPSPTMY